MLGHFLLTLTREEEDRVLTGKLSPVMNADRMDDGAGCLLQTVDDVTFPRQAPFGHFRRDCVHMKEAGERFDVGGTPYVRNIILHWSVGHRYDALCAKHGVEKIGSLIRERIWRNRAWRALQGHMEQQRERVTA